MIDWRDDKSTPNCQSFNRHKIILFDHFLLLLFLIFNNVLTTDAHGVARGGEATTARRGTRSARERLAARGTANAGTRDGRRDDARRRRAR